MNARADNKEFVGGACGPTKSGARANATWPLVLLSITEDAIEVRGRWIVKGLFRDDTAPLSDVNAKAIRGPFMGGVLIELGKNQKWLFWTPRRREVLESLANGGARVDNKVRWVRPGDFSR